MNFVTVPASYYTLPELVDQLNRGFEGYFLPIYFNVEMFSNMLRKDGIDLAESRVLVLDDQPCGIALIACRRSIHSSRLAAMGIARDARGRGAGSWLMRVLIEEAYVRGDREMVLEVIEQNQPAVKLYRKYGFESVRRLVGYISRNKPVPELGKGEMQRVDLSELGQSIAQHGLPDLPWQLSAESITQTNPPLHAYRKGPAYVAISNPEAEHIVIWSLLVAPEARGHGLSTEMLNHVMAYHAGKSWHVPAIFPEEMGKVFERAGLEKEELSQWQMKLSL